MKQECIALINESNKKVDITIYDAVKDGCKKLEKKIKDDLKKGKDED